MNKPAERCLLLLLTKAATGLLPSPKGICTLQPLPAAPNLALPPACMSRWLMPLLMWESRFPGTLAGEGGGWWCLPTTTQ